MNAQSLEHGREEHRLRARTALFWVVTPQLLRGGSLKSPIGCGCSRTGCSGRQLDVTVRK